MASSSSQRTSSENSGNSLSMIACGAEGFRGMPRTCICGSSTWIRTSGTSKNPGRLFHCCPNRTEKDNYHLFKWTDEGMVEEIEDMKKEIEDMKKKIEDMKNNMDSLKTEIQGCEKEMKELVGETYVLKSVIVCGVVFLGFK
ncbi:uncharacterized protein At1g43920, Chloroplastic-like [Eutrema salsugineum]|uniref:uncharacterized protein At1g43920, Chloroplastic-like n=1 Tax=Eutrema salsugineum TaxID=72664 RepID=UPI000CED5977|nr:uncharacterized protein At1g43920, Chloroplastic-like [Eutrema salsugineum]